ncbi:dTDP-4-dehydrorhamnose reductase [Homoserinibacter sp. YIM 151385]|uniref:dTDP-4-dehydrorhamnose reductase n=1 Tax=Homoserinibacter sp. YIM 151385 TaxID=2985506 RepID=UPI0022F04612|nr:dTDP-4-dehydrorhamnose reductase [Homoserinibacter sp. YIM 151385]WBU37755.1 dTDP-4-dehydrorhamnose reductase [Homoserinibacter sp. YIM 151385]
MRWLVTGGTGLLGRALAAALAGAGHEVRAPGSRELDIRSRGAVRDAVAGFRPDIVVNSAAWTAVDDAEAAEPAAHAVNALGAEHVAMAAASAGARFVQVSTDYVFDGRAASPYPEDAPLAPLGAYGRTKAAGERLARAAHPGALVVRTAWLYGGDAGFPALVRRLAARHPELSMVADQVGQPSWAPEVADGILRLVEAGAPAGVHHATASGAASRVELARAVLELDGEDPDRVRPVGSEAFPTPAPRPAYSVLGHGSWAAAGIPPLRDWREALAEAMVESPEQEAGRA